MVNPPNTPLFPHRHLLGIEGLSAQDIEILLDLAETAIEVSRQVEKKRSTLRGRTLINLFFETSTRTQSSFELAGKRLGADVMNMSVATSSVKKGETLIDTAVTLNAMRPDIIVVRHAHAGAVHLLARKVDCSVVNAGDGAHEIDAAGCSVGPIAEEDDEEPAHQNEQRSAGRVGDLQFIAAGDEFSAIPETAGWFHGHHKDCTGNQSHDPADDVVYSVETHWC